MFVPPHFQTQNLGLGIETTDICDVTLAWHASRCWARQMCPPTFCHVPTPLNWGLVLVPRIPCVVIECLPKGWGITSVVVILLKALRWGRFVAVEAEAQV